MKKYINENSIQDIGKNGYLVINGERTGISNLPTFCEKNKEIANANNIYDYIEDNIPEYNQETQYVKYHYQIIDNTIYTTYEIVEKIEDILEREEE